MPLQIIRQDITKIKCDAIVNPTNEDLFPSGGTDAAIHAAAGSALYEACQEIGHLDVGEVALTQGYNLPCKYVIYTVGPIWEDDTRGERALLENCYRNALLLALEKGCKSIAFPLISAGLYGFPKDQVLKIAIATISDFLFEHELQVTLAVFDKKSYQFSEKLFKDVTEYIDDHYVLEHSDNLDELLDIEEFLGDELLPSEICGKEINEQRIFCSEIRAPRERPLDLESRLKETRKNSFALKLFHFIDERGMSDVECYKKANVDKKTFSKIKCNENYRPSKQTVLAFAIALELSLSETQELLATVGFALSPGSKFDVIIEYFISKGNYNIYEINETLFEFDQCLLGV